MSLSITLEWIMGFSMETKRHLSDTQTQAVDRGVRLMNRLVIDGEVSVDVLVRTYEDLFDFALFCHASGENKDNFIDIMHAINLKAIAKAGIVCPPE